MPQHFVKAKTSPLHVEDHDAEDSNAKVNTRKIMSNSSVLCAVGFFSCMVVMELALEGAANTFSDLESLPYAVTISQFGSCFCLPVLVTRGEALSTFPKNRKEFIPYISLSLVVFGSTCLAAMAVRYVSYPTKIVFKSAKLIPTMIVSTFMQQGSRYGVMDYLAACLFCAGAAGYSWGEGRSEQSNSVAGVLLLLVSVFCDAFTSNIQQRLMSPPVTTSLPLFSKNRAGLRAILNRFFALFLPSQGGGLGVSAPSLMVNTNGVGYIGLVLFLFCSGTLPEILRAALGQPFLFVYLAAIGLSLSIAVLCYTRLIQESGSVVAVAVATLRKVATIILSYLVYPKAVSMVHALSGFLVFGGILLNAFNSREISLGKNASSRQ